MGKEDKRSKVCAVILVICISAAVFSAAVAAPIIVRPFYYAHIGSLDLTERSGMTEAQIKQSFDDVMDYCTGKTDSFSAGMLNWSDEGAAHFTDVRELFILDFWIIGMSISVIAAVSVFCVAKGRKPYYLGGHGPWFWSAVGVGTVMVLTALAGAANFSRAFDVFHRIFFPGKDNWVFYEDVDPVITILPQEFFRDCAILILVIIIISCAILMAVDYGILYRNRRKLNGNVYQK